jgi:hypothetical protein
MKSTVISMLPYDYKADFPGVIPPYWLIPGLDVEDLKRGDFNVIHVDDSIGYVPMLDGRSIMQRYPGEMIAGSIVNDHINSSYAANQEAFPGLKALPGVHKKDEILKNFSEELKGLDIAQRKWFTILVRLADDMWRTPLGRQSGVISDLQRTAAKVVSPGKEWINDVRVDLIPCPACTMSIPAAAMICPQCKTIINPAQYNKQFRQAEIITQVK